MRIRTVLAVVVVACGSAGPRPATIVIANGPSETPPAVAGPPAGLIHRAAEAPRALDPLPLARAPAPSVPVISAVDLGAAVAAPVDLDVWLARGVAELGEPSFDQRADADAELWRIGQLLQRAGRLPDARAAYLRLIKDHPASAFIPDVYVAFGDYYFDQAALADAQQFYAKAATFPRAPVAAYARYKLAWVLLDLDRPQDALTAFAEVAATAGAPALVRAAVDDAVVAYAQAGRADRALAFFDHLDHDRAFELLARLGEAYLDRGLTEQALAILREAIARDPSASRVCHARVVELRVRFGLGDRRKELALATELVAAATAPDCRAEADAMVGEMAEVWHLELAKSEEDPALITRAWELELQLATTPARRAIAARNRALLLWERAESGAGRDVHAWVVAAAAAQDAAALDPSAADLAQRAADARHNAQVSATTTR